MLNKTIKLFAMTLMGATFFMALPFIGYAQYYNGYGASATTGNVTNISPMNATFNGTVSTGGLPGNAWFEYGTDLSFGYSTTLNAFIFNGGYSGNYSTNVSGLTSNTVYYFRAVAQNSYGRAYGNVVSFRTNLYIPGYNNSMPPTAVTTSAAVLASNTAQMNALILTGNSQNANSYFEWGTTSDLSNQTAITPLSGSPAIRHTNTLTGLAPGTTYYFRAVAQNSYGTSDGTILSFTTSGTRSYSSENRNTSSSDASGSSNTANTTTNITGTDTTSVYNGTNYSFSPADLGANTSGSGSSFLPASLLGWLILLILVLVLALLGKRFLNDLSRKNHIQ
jgi:phosphodiesterase/alkaline phosphatase D-like protein